MESRIWDEVTSLLSQGQKLKLLYMSRKSQAFIINKIDTDYIRIKFIDSGGYLKLDRSRFNSAWNYLNKNKGNWVKIGSSRKYTKSNTLEGAIKKEFNNNMNGTATATWIAAILVRVFSNIEFNGKFKDQEIRLILWTIKAILSQEDYILWKVSEYILDYES